MQVRALVALGDVRFPFTFMGVFSLGLGAWIGGYALLHPTTDPVTRALELVPVVTLVVFGVYLVYRRLAHGPAA